jgi:hypothetical protein
VIRPESFESFEPENYAVHSVLESLNTKKREELDSLFTQGGVVVVFLDTPSYYSVSSDFATIREVNNYGFLHNHFAACVNSAHGQQITYIDTNEPFVQVLNKSTVAWTAYMVACPAIYPFNDLKFFAKAGAAGFLAGKMPCKEGQLVLLPNVSELDEDSFLEVCREYRFQKQGTTPPDWTHSIFLPGLPPIESEIADVDQHISKLQEARSLLNQQLDERAAYRKLLYEKGMTQLEPIVRRALGDLEFGVSPGEIIQGTNFEIDGRTSTGSTPGIIEVKGSKNQIAFGEFSGLVTKLLADQQASGTASKGILVGNGFCETAPSSRLGHAVFTAHILEGAKKHSVALINSVELYWLCCSLLDGTTVDKNAVREAILTGNGYVDLKPFCGKSPFPTSES